MFEIFKGLQAADGKLQIIEQIVGQVELNQTIESVHISGKRLQAIAVEGKTLQLLKLGKNWHEGL